MSLNIPKMYERFPVFNEHGEEIGSGLREFGKVATTFAFGPKPVADHIAMHQRLQNDAQGGAA